MKARLSLARTVRTQLAAATIAAYASQSESGFRLKDVKFLFQLFSNWSEQALGYVANEIQSTQISRYLSSLVPAGFIVQKGGAKSARFKLTKSGVLELVSEITRERDGCSPHEFLFIFYFVKNYRSWILKLIHNFEDQFPPAVQQAIEELLDVKVLLSREKENIKRSLALIQKRSGDSQKAADLADNMQKQNAPFERIVQQIEKTYPYGLNSQKLLSELIKPLPKDIAKWEVHLGNRARISDMWNPTIALLIAYQEVIAKLSYK